MHSSHEKQVLFVCVEVLRPSQPSGVMLSAVSLPNHAFTGLAKSSEGSNQYCCILSLETDKVLPFLNQQKGQNDHRKYFKIKSPRKNVVDLVGVKPATT